MDGSPPNIWQLQAQQDVAGLINALQYDDPGVRKRAATALRTLDASESLSVLTAAVDAETDWQAQASMSAALQYLQRENRLEELIAQENVEELIEMLSVSSDAEIIIVARALGRIGDKLAAEPLIVLFQDGNLSDDARYIIADSLIRLQSAPAMVSLVAGLERDEWQARRNSAAVLGQLKATWAAPAIAQALWDEHPMVRRTAEAALKRFNTPAAHELLDDWKRHLAMQEKARMIAAKKLAKKFARETGQLPKINLDDVPDNPNRSDDEDTPIDPAV